MNKLLDIRNYVSKHLNIFTFIFLGLIFYIIFFHNIGNYALMDVDETRYVSMARDMFQSKNFLTLYLNNEYFFEKPPLYFWIECLSFSIFGEINEFAARFPVAFFGMASCYLVYFIGKKIVSRKYGIISSLILATSLEFVILAKFAILDIIVSTCISFSLFIGLIIHFCRESHKKYYWWLFYLFSALAVMAKGIPGFVIPFGSMFFISIVSKSFKEIFKPQYFLIGILIFLLIVLPWHIIMLKTYNPLFWNEYIIKHHVERFLGAESINRSEPFYFYFLTLLWGFFPWIISCLTVFIKNITIIIKNKLFSFDLNKLNKQEKFILYNSIIALFILIFFSSSGTKLITYILPIYGSLAFLGGFIWYEYIQNNKNSSLINKTNYCLGGLLLLASFGTILTPIYLPEQIYQNILCVKTLCMLSTFACGLGIILFTKRKIYLGVFASIIIFISILSAFGTKEFFKIDYKFGQDELIEYSKIATQDNVSLTTYDFGHKYSLIFYSKNPVTFYAKPINNDLNYQLKKENNYVIVEQKDRKKFKNATYKIIAEGKKYVLIDEVK